MSDEEYRATLTENYLAMLPAREQWRVHLEKRMEEAMTHTVKAKTTVWATSLYWRDCDPFISVIGFNRVKVERRAQEIATQEIADAQDGLEDGEYLQDVLCGGKAFQYSVSDFIPETDLEHLRELAEDGLTVL